MGQSHRQDYYGAPDPVGVEGPVRNLRQFGVLGVPDLLLTSTPDPVPQVSGGDVPALVGGVRGDTTTANVGDPQVTAGGSRRELALRLPECAASTKPSGEIATTCRYPGPGT